MFEVTDSKLEMRSNKVWDEETAGLPGLVENSNGRDIKEKVFELTTATKTSEDASVENNNGREIKEKLTTATKTNEDARVGSLADAEAVQAATDQRRGKEVTKEIYFGHLVS